ncbi:MAG: site-2 protease family protein [Arenimonas sp.]
MTDSKPKKTKKPALGFFIIMLLPALGGYSISRLAFQMTGFKASLPAFNAFDAFAILILIMVVLAIHELSHLMGGFTRGMKFLLFIVGPFQWIKTADGIRFSLVFNPGSFGGLAAALPNPDQALAPQLKRLVVGGPLASLLLFILCMLVGMALSGKPAFYFYFIGGFSLLIFLVTALPFRAGGFMSDGMQLLELMRGGVGVEERQIITNLMMQSMAGVRPRDLDQKVIDHMLRFESLDPMRQVIARYYAYISQSDRGEHDLASEYIAWLEQHIDQYPQGFRQSLTLEICLNYLLRDNLEEAREWMKKSTGGIVDESRRALIEAEFALSENDKDRARELLGKARKLSSRSYDNGLRIMTLEQVALAEKKLEKTDQVSTTG